MTTDQNENEYLICPISKLYFLDLVVASDGQTYERECIEEWLLSNDISPLTKQVITSKLFPNQLIKYQVMTLLEKHPELKESQYIAAIKVYNHSQITMFKKFMADKDYDQLLKYHSYTPEFLADIQHDIDNLSNGIIQHIIDTWSDLKSSHIMAGV